MTQSRYLVPLVWLLGAFGGCADTKGRTGSPIPIDEFPLSFAGAFCEQYLECASARASDYELSLLSLSPSFGALCPTLLVRELDGLDELVDGVLSGRIEYDPAAARRCVEEVARSCTPEPSLDLFSSCREAFLGAVPLDGSCVIDLECEPGTHCDATLIGGMCEGTCVAQGPLGSACVRREDCLSPADRAGFALCEANGGAEDVCVFMAFDTELGEGESCGLTDNTGLERRYGACAAAFYCDDPDDDGEGICREPLPEGATCLVREACEAGTVCMERDMVRTCTRITVSTKVGEPCDDETVLCDYPARLECVAGVCQAFAAGDCEQDYHCGVGEYCNYSNQACEPLKDLGEECDDGDECVSGVCEDDGTMSSTSRCAERIVCG